MARLAQSFDRLREKNGLGHCRRLWVDPSVMSGYGRGAYGTLNLPVANAAAVTQTGVSAASCVTGAASAFLRGWTNPLGTSLGYGASGGLQMGGGNRGYSNK